MRGHGVLNRAHAPDHLSSDCQRNGGTLLDETARHVPGSIEQLFRIMSGVHQALDRVRDKLHELALSLPIGDGMQPGTLFGPIQNLPQYRRVLQMRDEARAAGLVLLEGAAVPEQGFFMPLTLVDNPPDDARVVTEEAFGPLLPLLRFRDIDEVITRANNSEYGLAGAVWSKDVSQALAIAKRLETGTVWINQNLESSPSVPLGGHKQSGIGVENGVAGLMEFTQAKSIFVPKSA